MIAAPMAGVSDRAFRGLARRFGAGLAVSEMVSARPETRATRKSRLRLEHRGETGPIAVQIAGADPLLMADAARYNAAQGADIIDINMGCPAKKVCNVLAGSALLEDERRVGEILDAVVRAVEVPVTLKIRTGPHPGRRNALRIARIAQAAGVQMLCIHGRTRACAFRGTAEYDTIAEVKAAVDMPVIANGDIRTPEDARRVLERTGADGVMIGRAAHGRPWVFREIAHYLQYGTRCAAPGLGEIRDVLLEHLDGLYALYGCEHGARIARKHIAWTVRDLPQGETLRRTANATENAQAQIAAVHAYFAQLPEADRAPAANESDARRRAA
ncbi:MAG TPA: tRNA dihydrouridine synthase DusB [Burkholderiales bacterium]|nr:tRNA dihydrouridine synthase DusB [Burkholderiales bacterium]